MLWKAIKEVGGMGHCHTESEYEEEIACKEIRNAPNHARESEALDEHADGKDPTDLIASVNNGEIEEVTAIARLLCIAYTKGRSR